MPGKNRPKSRDCLDRVRKFSSDEERTLPADPNRISDHATIEEVREQLAQALRTIEALTQNTVDLRAAAAQTIAHLETIAADAVEEMTQAVVKIQAVTAELRQARGAARNDQRMTDEVVDGAMHVIGYGPPGTIGLTFASNAEATAATGGCSHERIKGCRDEHEAAAFVQAVH